MQTVNTILRILYDLILCNLKSIACINVEQNHKSNIAHLGISLA